MLGVRGSSQKRKCQTWLYSSFVPTTVTFFSPACDVEPSCLLRSSTTYSFSVAPFLLIFPFLQHWPHNLNLLFLYSSFHSRICLLKAPTHLPTHRSQRTSFHFLCFLPWVYSQHVWTQHIQIYAHKCLYKQLVNELGTLFKISLWRRVYPGLPVSCAKYAPHRQSLN